MSRVPNTKNIAPTEKDLDDEYEFETIPGLGFSGTLSMIGRFLRRVFGLASSG